MKLNTSNLLKLATGLLLILLFISGFHSKSLDRKLKSVQLTDSVLRDSLNGRTSEVYKMSKKNVSNYIGNAYVDSLKKNNISPKRVVYITDYSSKGDYKYKLSFKKDTVVRKDTVNKVVTKLVFKSFEHNDNYVHLSGSVLNDSIKFSMTTVDTLRQVIYKIPHKFLFIKYGVKGVKQTIFNSNPHNKIIYSRSLYFK